jgi:hypothetical protein
MKSLWENFFFGASSHIYDHHMDGKFQAYDLFEMAHFELALHFFMASFKLMITHCRTFAYCLP